ncbi:lytic transglycosylase domain-containing protein [Sinomonas halotolerans]|uniref:Lytic murein transglycosylase n=1 Tax=Sinomonas halotolerans TaxID=1644133 RepID=A0ABU9X1I0_9MICC
MPRVTPVAAANAVAAGIVLAFVGWVCSMPGPGAAAEAVPAGYLAVAPAPDGASAPAAGMREGAAAEAAPTASHGRTATLLDPGWVESTAGLTGIPSRALQAYAAAGVVVQRERPDCHLGWNTLAAIGFVESAHATHGNGELAADGYSTAPIIGPALNGDGYAAIRDSDAGEFDGDRQWDRAVGPLQFIPETWRQFGRDGDGNGVADPQQIDDAALAAAGYLCEAGGNLGEGPGWTRAVYAYNNSRSYAEDVRAKAIEYAARAAAAG